MAVGRTSLALAAFTDPALALSFAKALPQPENYRAVIESLDSRTRRIRQRQQEQKACQRNKAHGKKRRECVAKKDV